MISKEQNIEFTINTGDITQMVIELANGQIIMMVENT